MTAKDQLIQEIEQAPDSLVEEVLNFLLFIKIRLAQRVNKTALSLLEESVSISEEAIE